MRCSTCGRKTNNRKSKTYPGGVFCDNCRAAIDASQRRQREWQAQTGNRNFQHRRNRA